MLRIFKFVSREFMKIQLDTKNKTIKIEDDVKLSELVDTLERLLPKGKWKEFTLEVNTIIDRWSSPIIIRERRRPWWEYPHTWMDCSSTSLKDSTPKDSMYELKSGTYNIET